MDGDGRWAKQRGLPRTDGHKVGESALLDVIMGAIELGIPYLSAYAFLPRTGGIPRTRSGS